ncbi:serine hydrolase [Streptomyces sp. MNU76]|nr:serine hydrolase [Streptomyces sp. MNU76]
MAGLEEGVERPRGGRTGEPARVGVTPTARRPDRAPCPGRRGCGFFPGQSPGEVRYVRDADAQAPAGGAGSSALDLARRLRLQLANGELDGDRVIATAPSNAPTSPGASPSHRPRRRAAPASTASAGTSPADDLGRLRLSHTGAFALGAHTNATMLPGERLGIVVLTNGSPVGLADAVALRTAGATSVTIEAFDADGLRPLRRP